MKPTLAVLFLLNTIMSAQPREIATARHTLPIDYDFSRQPLPTYRSGFLLARHRTPPGFSVWDRSGQLLVHRELTLPGVSDLSIGDIAAASRGNAFVLSVSARNADGRVACLLVWTRANGDIQKIVETSSFAARRIIFAPDGTLWAFGRVYNNKFEEQADYDTLRQYGTEGKLIRSALKRSLFKPSKQAPSAESYMAIGDGRIGVVSLAASEWVELSSAGEVVGHWPLQIPAGAYITGAALSSSNDLFITQEKETSTLSRFDKKNGTFTNVDTSTFRNSPGQGVLLAGSEGDQLVVRIKPPNLLIWIDVK